MKHSLREVAEAIKPRVLEVARAMGKLAVFTYLVVILLLTLYLVARLWMVDVKDTGPAAVGDFGKPTDGSPKITSIEPGSVVIGGNRSNIALYGYNFAADEKVKLNGVEHAFNMVSETELTVALAASDLMAPEVVAVTVVKGAQASNVVHFKVLSAADERVDWRVLRWRWNITLESRLLLMVLFVGGLAACVSALKSFADYAGEGKLTQEWYWLYVARPFVGAGLAFVFYLVIRGGFLAGTAADIKAVNPFGLAAVAALVAMFSDKALQKLGDIFDTLFKTEDTRAGKLKGLAIATPSPLPPAPPSQAYSLTLTARDGTPGYTWTAVTALPAGLTLSGSGMLSGTPTAARGKASFTVKVTDSAGASATKDLEITI